MLPNGEARGGVIPFFGGVVTTSVRVDLRGLAIIVTMAKVLSGAQFQWPRLLPTRQSARWLKYYQKFDQVEDQDLEQDYSFVIPPGKNFIDSDHQHVDIEYLS